MRETSDMICITSVREGYSLFFFNKKLYIRIVCVTVTSITITVLGF